MNKIYGYNPLTESQAAHGLAGQVAGGVPKPSPALQAAQTYNIEQSLNHLHNCIDLLMASLGTLGTKLNPVRLPQENPNASFVSAQRSNPQSPVQAMIEAQIERIQNLIVITDSLASEIDLP